MLKPLAFGPSGRHSQCAGCVMLAESNARLTEENKRLRDLATFLSHTAWYEHPMERVAPVIVEKARAALEGK